MKKQKKEKKNKKQRRRDEGHFGICKEPQNVFCRATFLGR